MAEVLSFFCYCEIPTGHNLVLGGFDQLMQFQNEHGRFDAWMRVLENTIDGRGRLGSFVNASDEYKKGGIGMDGSLMEYAVNFYNIFYMINFQRNMIILLYSFYIVLSLNFVVLS